MAAAQQACETCLAFPTSALQTLGLPDDVLPPNEKVLDLLVDAAMAGQSAADQAADPQDVRRSATLVHAYMLALAPTPSAAQAEAAYESALAQKRLFTLAGAMHAGKFPEASQDEAGMFAWRAIRKADAAKAMLIAATSQEIMGEARGLERAAGIVGKKLPSVEDLNAMVQTTEKASPKPSSPSRRTKQKRQQDKAAHKAPASFMSSLEDQLPELASVLPDLSFLSPFLPGVAAAASSPAAAPQPAAKADWADASHAHKADWAFNTLVESMSCQDEDGSQQVLFNDFDEELKPKRAASARKASEGGGRGKRGAANGKKKPLPAEEEPLGGGWLREAWATLP